jgi:hypothetical protein
MSKKIYFTKKCINNRQPRVGGGPLIGGVLDWPTTPNGVELTLLMSLPTKFLNDNIDTNLPDDKFISVFSFYSKKEYFLEYITYHGDPSELILLRKGYTRVFMHDIGDEIHRANEITAMLIEIKENLSGEVDHFQGSKLGNPISFLQNNQIKLENQNFVLQIYGGDFPENHKDILFLSDAIGYLFLDSNPNSGSTIDAGTFFVQTT